MDTLTHALSGALLVRLLAARAVPVAAHSPNTPTAGRWSAPWDGAAGAPALRSLVLAGAVAAAAPDADYVLHAFGDLAYLTQHRGLTHSLLLLPLWALLLSWLASTCDPTTRAQPGGWRSYYVVMALALALHLAGDWITQFGTMLLHPLSTHRFGLGAVFIIDLALSGTLVVGLALAAVFPRRRWPAALGLTAAAAWVGVTWVGQQEARGIGVAHARAAGIAAAVVEVMPRPASPFNWTVAVGDGQTWHVAHLNTRRSERVLAGPDAHFFRRFTAPYVPVAQAEWQVVPRLGDAGTPDWVRTAWQADAFAFFRWFALAPALSGHSAGVDARGKRERCAWFRDLRFEFPGREGAPFTYGVCLLGEGSEAPVRIYKRGDDGGRIPV